MIVAEGTAYMNSNIIHTSSVLNDHYRVSVDAVRSEYMKLPLPVVPWPGEIKLLGEAKKSFVQWPIRLVIFDEQPPVSIY